MFLSRQIGSVLRGRARPIEVSLACLFGGMLGFVPGFFLPGDLGGGFAQAPGLILLLLAAVLIANANLGVFGVTLLLAKLLSFGLLPVAYTIGTWLCDGPLAGLFGWLVEAPVTAWFGLEYYATTGGLVLGVLFGLAAGFLLNRLLRTLRRRMAELDENSDRFHHYSRKWWVRFLSWLFFGRGKGKKHSWRELSEAAKGLPVRVLGLVAASILVGGVVVFQGWFSTPLLTGGVRDGLAAWNGASVDLDEARLGLGDGTLRLAGLAIADREDLAQDLFAATELVATVDTGALLRRRLVIDELRATDARAGTKRGTPGVLLPRPEPAPEPPVEAPAGSKTLDDYLADYERWQGRIEQVREWIEWLQSGDESADGAGGEPTAEQREQERREQEQAGLAKVVARHLLRERPGIVIRKVDIEGIRVALPGGDEAFDLRLHDLSDAPSRLAEAAGGSLRARSDWLTFELVAPRDGAAKLDFALRELSVDALLGQLRLGGTSPVQGGTVSLAVTGGALAGGGRLELPLQATLEGTTFVFQGMQPTRVDSLVLPIGLSGKASDPVVRFDSKVLQDALLQAGQAQLANFVQQQAGKLLGDGLLGGQLPVDLTKPPGEIVDEAAKQAEEAAKQAEEAAKKAAEKAAEDAAKKLIPGGLNGLLPKKKS